MHKMRRVFLIAVLLSLFLAPNSVLADEWDLPPVTTTPGARSGHSMVNLNGSPYVFGGKSEESLLLNDLWELNIEQAAWEEQQAANPPTGHSHHAAGVLNGKMYVFFGADDQGGYWGDVWRYDPGLVAWTRLAESAPCGARAGHAATLGSGGVFWISGGHNSGGDLQDMWTYSPAGGWTPKPDMPYALSGHSAVSYDGQIYVYGGSRLLRFDPDANTWTELSTPQFLMPRPRFHHVAILDLPNKVMRVFGGTDPNGAELSDVWEYQFAAKAWASAGQMPLPLTESAAAMVYAIGAQASAHLQATDRMVLYGGLSGGAPTDHTYYYYRFSFSIYLPLVSRPS